MPRSVAFVLDPRRSSAFYFFSPRRPSSSRARPRAPRARDPSSVARLRARASRRPEDAREIGARDVESSNRVLGETRRRRRVVVDRRRRLESIARSAPRPRDAIDARSSRDGRRPVDAARARSRRESRANRARTHRIARIASSRASTRADATTPRRGVCGEFGHTGVDTHCYVYDDTRDPCRDGGLCTYDALYIAYIKA